MAGLTFAPAANATVLDWVYWDYDNLHVRALPGETNQLTARSLGSQRSSVLLSQTGALFRLSTPSGLPLVAPPTPCLGGLVLAVCDGMPIVGELGDGNDSVDTTALPPAAPPASGPPSTWKGDDHWDLGPGNDVFRGGASDEVVEPRGGNDRLDLGPGDDTVMLHGSAAAVTIRCGPGTDAVYLQQSAGAHAIAGDCEHVSQG